MSRRGEGVRVLTAGLGALPLPSTRADMRSLVSVDVRASQCP